MSERITKECYEKILYQAELQFDSLVKDYYGLHNMRKEGASFRFKCPDCDGSSSLVYTPAKAILKCFKCHKDGEAAKGVYSWCTRLLKLEGKRVIEFLAEKLNIFIEYEPARTTKVATKISTETIQVSNDFKTFRDTMLEQSGLTVEDVTGEIKIDNSSVQHMVRYTSGSKNGDQIVKGDDVVLHYKTLYGTLTTYQKKRANGESYGKHIPFIRIRNRRPEDHLDKNGKPKKYESPYNSGLNIWHPEPLIRKFQTKSVIKTLFLQEGEKKADKNTKHSLFSCGIMGINFLIDANGLHPDFGLIITQCKTERVVFVVDADWQYKIPSGANENIDNRARSFLSAVRKFQQYFYGFTNQGIHLKIYFSYVKPNANNDKGTDDLLTCTLKGKEDELLQDYEYAMAQGDGQGKYIACIDITGFSEHKLKELFHLQSKEAFVELHKTELKKREEFYFSGTKWKFADDDTLELAQPLAPDHIFWKRKSSRSSGEERFEFKPDRWVNVSHDRWHIGRFLIHKDSEAFKLVIADPVTRTIKTVNIIQISDFMLNFLYNINEIEVYNWLFLSDKYLNDKKITKLWFLNDIIHLLKTEKKVGYMYFKNGFWKITDSEIKHYPINDSPGYIWSDKVKDAQPVLDKAPLFKIIRTEDGKFNVNFREDWHKCHFLKFMFNTGLFSGHLKLPTEKELEEAYKNLISKITAFGYLMHHFFDPSNTKMVYALDGKDREIGQASGRSGKSQFFSALEKLINVVTIDGRKPNLLDDKYIFAKVTEQTGLIYFDDLDPTIEPGFMYGLISGGKVESRGMHKEAIIIPQEYTPKVAGSSNYGMKGVLQNDSSLDRLFFIVFSGYYSKDHKPVDDFGIRFFDDWEYDQWTSFYNMAACCYQAFLEHGLVDFGDMRQKKVFLSTEIGPTFMEWADGYIRDKDNFDKWLERPAMQEDYKALNSKFALRPTQFRLKLVMYASYHDRVLNPDKGPLVNVGNVGYAGGRRVTEGKEYFKVGYALPDSIRPDNGGNEVNENNEGITSSIHDDVPF